MAQRVIFIQKLTSTKSVNLIVSKFLFIKTELRVKLRKLKFYRIDTRESKYVHRVDLLYSLSSLKIM